MSLILVVDDEKDIREVMGTVLELEGFQVIKAENGEQALEVLGSLRDVPVLIILDLMMPVMDGFEFLRVIDAQSEGRFSRVPILVVTAFNQKERPPRAAEVVLKPLGLETLIAAVRANATDPQRLPSAVPRMP